MSSAMSLMTDTTLRAWIRLAEHMPDCLPIVQDMRISARSELWRREDEAMGEMAWPAFGPWGDQ